MFKMRDVFHQRGTGLPPELSETPPYEQAPMNEADPMELEPDLDVDDTFGASLGRENEMNGRPKAYPRKLF